MRKDKIILQLEQKIRSQEATIQDLVCGSGRTTRARGGALTRGASEDTEKIQVHVILVATSSILVSRLNSLLRWFGKGN